MNEIELSLEDTVWGLVRQSCGHHFNKLVGSHPCIFNHLEETSPNKGPAENVLDWVDILDEEVQRYRIDNVLGESVVLEVQKDAFVAFGSIVVSYSLLLREHQYFDHIYI